MLAFSYARSSAARTSENPRFLWRPDTGLPSHGARGPVSDRPCARPAAPTPRPPAAHQSAPASCSPVFQCRAHHGTSPAEHHAQRSKGPETPLNPQTRPRSPRRQRGWPRPRGLALYLPPQPWRREGDQRIGFVTPGSIGGAAPGPEGPRRHVAQRWGNLLVRFPRATRPGFLVPGHGSGDGAVPLTRAGPAPAAGCQPSFLPPAGCISPDAPDAPGQLIGTGIHDDAVGGAAEEGQVHRYAVGCPVSPYGSGPRPPLSARRKTLCRR